MARRHVRLTLLAALLTAAIPTPCAAAAPVRLRVWQLSMRPTLAGSLAREFERRNPGIAVELETLSWDDGFQKLVLAVASRNPPDVFELGSTWIPQFRSAGILAPLDPVADELRTHLLLTAPGETGGKTDAIPWLLGTRQLFVNRTLLSAAGWNEAPRTPVDLLKFCREYASARQNAPCIGLAAGDPYAGWQQFLSFAWSDDPGLFGARLSSRDLLKPAIARTADLYASLRPFAFADRPSILDRRFAQGTLPFVVSGAWLPLVLRDAAPSLDYEVAPIPAAAPNGSHAFAGGEYLVVSTAAPREDALRFVRFMLERSTLASITAAQPGLLAARDDTPPPGLDARTTAARAAMARALKTAVAPPSDPAWAAAETSLSSIADGILLTGERPPAAIERTMRLVEESLVSSGARGGSRALAAVVLWIADAAALVALAILVFRMRRSGDTWAHVLLSAPWLAAFAALCVLPAAYLALVSFTSYDLLAGNAAAAGLRNYASVPASPEFRHSLLVTAVFTAASVPITLVLALAAAYGVRRLGRLTRPAELLIYLPPVLPVVVTASILSFIFAGGGPVDQLIAAAGMSPPRPPWLVNPSLALAVVVVHAVWTSFGYYALFFIAGLSAIPASVREAAELDGAGVWRQFADIDWPALRGIGLVCAAIQTVRSLQVFPEVLVLTGGGPVGATTTVVYRLYEEAFRRFDFGRAAAIATLLMLAIVAISLPLLRKREARP